MAIGELQKNAGADQRITARADILDANTANPRLTGVWKSWDKVVTTGGAYAYLDHSFLLNLALYDHYFFSGLADQTGPFITSTKTTSALAIPPRIKICEKEEWFFS